MKRIISKGKENADKAKVYKMCIIDNEPATADTCDISVLVEKDAKVNICKELTNDQMSDSEGKLSKNLDVFSNKLRLTSSLTYNIKLTTDKPVQFTPIPYHQETFDAEVQNARLRNNITV